MSALFAAPFWVWRWNTAKSRSVVESESMIASQETYRFSPSGSFVSGLPHFGLSSVGMIFSSPAEAAKSIHKNRDTVPINEIAATTVRIVLVTLDLSAIPPSVVSLPASQPLKRIALCALRPFLFGM